MYLKPAASDCVTEAFQAIHAASLGNSPKNDPHRFWLAIALPCAFERTIWYCVRQNESLTILSLICSIARDGAKPFGHTSVQFMIERQRNSR